MTALYGQSHLHSTIPWVGFPFPSVGIKGIDVSWELLDSRTEEEYHLSLLDPT